ncbi:hypothetical protein Tco_0462433 [Tanacetum coccineum]
MRSFKSAMSILSNDDVVTIRQERLCTGMSYQRVMDAANRSGFSLQSWQMFGAFSIFAGLKRYMPPPTSGDMITTLLTLMRSSAECARIVLASSRLERLNGRKNRNADVALKQQSEDTGSLSESQIDKL